VAKPVNIKSEIRNSNLETNPNDINTKIQNEKSVNTKSLLDSFKVLNIRTFEFRNCCEFRNSCFGF
jgi:hypothetical protein